MLNFVTDETNTRSAKLVNMSQACHLSDIFSTLNVNGSFAAIMELILDISSANFLSDHKERPENRNLVVLLIKLVLDRHKKELQQSKAACCTQCSK